LARRTQVPENYLAKLLLALGKAGIVAATRGSGGGYRLQPGALEVPLVNIVETFDGTRVRPSCLLGREHPCSDEDPCPAHFAWRDVREAYLEFLETTKLADIAQYPLREFGSKAKSLGVLSETGEKAESSSD
jgi:Rrf2 family protein